MQIYGNAEISPEVTAYFSKSDKSLSKVIKDTVLNSSIAFVVSDVRPLSAVESDKLIQFANAIVGSVVEWLKHRTDDQHGLGSKPICAILLCPWERHFTALSPAWWS